MKRRVGVFGGTFDPPHRAHLRVALAACDALMLDHLLWIPAGQPPHKEESGISAPHHRAEMTRLMSEADPRFRLDLGELDAQGPSWTVLTLERLRREHPQWDLVLVMGEDQWASFSTWHRPNDILAMAEVAVYHRPHTESARAPDHPTHDHPPDYWLPGECMSYTSTMIRDTLRQGKPIDHLVLPSVAAYIRQHHLYGLS